MSFITVLGRSKISSIEHPCPRFHQNKYPGLVLQDCRIMGMIFRTLFQRNVIKLQALQTYSCNFYHVCKITTIGFSKICGSMDPILSYNIILTCQRCHKIKQQKQLQSSSYKLNISDKTDLCHFIEFLFRQCINMLRDKHDISLKPCYIHFSVHRLK